MRAPLQIPSHTSGPSARLPSSLSPFARGPDALTGPPVQTCTGGMGQAAERATACAAGACAGNCSTGNCSAGNCPLATATLDELHLHYLAYANIRCLIDRHMAERSLMIDVHTRHLLARLSETTAHCAERLRARLLAAPQEQASPP